MKNVFKSFRDRILVFVDALGAVLSDLLGLEIENKLENKVIFL